MKTRRWFPLVVALGSTALGTLVGCVTTKQTDTARTGIEQLLLSTATDQALDKVDLSPIARAKVFVDTQYLDCVDKNYVIVSLHQRLLRQDCKLVDKREDADVIVEVGAGSLGTDRTEWFVGVPEIPLAMPSPISIPKLSVFTRTKSIGTAKLCVVALDVKTHQAVINSGYSLAQRPAGLERARRRGRPDRFGPARDRGRHRRKRIAQATVQHREKVDADALTIRPARPRSPGPIPRRPVVRSAA